MVRNAKDVPGLNILNSNLGKGSVSSSSNSVQNSSNNIFAGNTKESNQVVTSVKGNMTSSSSSNSSR